MRVNVMVPTNGSSMILKAIADSGSLSAGLRSTSLPLRSVPLMAPRSSGFGRKSTTASSSRCTPLFFKAEPRTDPAAARGLRDEPLQRGLGRLLAVEVGGIGVVVEIDRRFHHLDAVLARLLLEVGGNLLVVVLGAEPLVVPHHRLHADEVDDALERALRPDRKLDADRVRPHPPYQIVDPLQEIGADLVHLVD